MILLHVPLQGDQDDKSQRERHHPDGLLCRLHQHDPDDTGYRASGEVDNGKTSPGTKYMTSETLVYHCQLHVIIACKIPIPT